MTASTLLNVREVAARLKLHPEEVRKRARTGALPGRKDGHRTVFVEAEIDALIDALPKASR